MQYVFSNEKHAILLQLFNSGKNVVSCEILVYKSVYVVIGLVLLFM